MSIAEQIRAGQNIQEMTHRAIEVLLALGQPADDLIAEYEAAYHEKFATVSN